MQQLIDERVNWLHLLPRPTRQSPEGHTLVMLDSFISEYGFHPKHYAQFQALAGKQESGVSGASGVGAKAAKKLIKRWVDVVSGGEPRDGKVAGPASDTHTHIHMTYIMLFVPAFKPGTPASTMSATPASAVSSRAITSRFKLESSRLVRRAAA